MRFLSFLISFGLTVVLVAALNSKIGVIPPMGKFLSPFHGFYNNAETKDDAFSNDLPTLAGLKEPVTLQYDEFLVPHIKASNAYDLYFMQGYITAKHRLWQMEIQTHFAAGRLSEIFGSSMLERDRTTRRSGLPYGAQKAVEEMLKDPEVKEALEAYAYGVNTYINSLAYRNLPLEYKLLNYRPEPWTPLKSALLLKYMANTLAGRDYDVENTNLVQLLGKETFDLLFPERLPDDDPVIPANTPWNFQTVKYKKPETELIFPKLALRDTVEQPHPDNGSNNWAVSGSKTKSGNPILCNDPHLTLNLPSIWYSVQLHGPDVNVYGVSLPGTPSIIIGFNDSIAWGVTNATRDVKDWYSVKFRNKKRKEYLYGNKWLKAQTKVEEIKIRPANPWDKPISYFDTVIYTHHGPVVYDENLMGDSSSVNLALKWTALEASNELKTFLKLNKAKNYEDYRNAIVNFLAPAQNFVFASANNNIALVVQGKFPIKWPQQGKFLMEGSNPDYEWQGYIPVEQNAFILNPERGFVSSANQIPTDSTYPYYVYDQNYEHYRNRRINEQLRSMENITVEDMMKLQNDNYNLHAAETLPWMLDSLSTSQLNKEQQEFYKMLIEWDYQSVADKTAPALFDLWWKNLNDTLWDELNVPLPILKPASQNTAYFLNSNPTHQLIDNKNTKQTEDLKELLVASFKQTINDLTKWQRENKKEFNWGNYKNSSIRHLTNEAAFSFTELQINGGKHIVNANSGRHGASWRMVVELGDTINAFGVYPGGQSGNPGSPYYGNMIESWRTGAYNQLYFITDKTLYTEKIIYSAEIKPGQ